MKRVLLILLTLALTALACGEQTAAVTPAPLDAPAAVGEVVPKGGRILSIDVTDPADGDYDAALRAALSAGAQAVGLSVFWDDIETAPGEYQPNPNFLEIANAYYPARRTAIDLVLNPIDTNQLRTPADLRDRPFDDPEVIARFNKLLDYVFAQIPDLELVSLSIGNEIDAYLGTDADKWAQYQAFFEAASAHARELRPGLVVGTKGMFDGITGESAAYFQAINAHSDAVLATYYPLNADFTVRDPSVVTDDFAALAAAYPGKPIYLLEAGYPSSPDCDSSEEKQAQFVHEVFRAWDAHADQIIVISFTWLNDIPPASVNELESYYGFSNRGFAAYLGTLGLRAYDGTDKAAFIQLKDEAKARGW
ncbi:MAG: hypothetical protein GXP40_11735 [Chloroflexi bacterium]|nr:hypothetical protein [Chloroflexota bacterium]